MKQPCDREQVLLHYIDGCLDREQAEALKDIAASDQECIDELFETKHIADMTRYGKMSIRDQERRMIELIHKAKAADRNRRRRKLLLGITTYAAIAVFAFAAGALTLHRMFADNVVTISSEAGNKADVCLPDGTKVALKSSSVLSYNIADFSRSQRRVQLDGEAFFDVAKDNDRKFVVETDRQEVTVHGTSFNLQAFRDDEFSILTLLDGSVTVDLFSFEDKCIRSLDIKSMERCICDLRTGHATVERINPSELEIDWDGNVCHFRNKDLEYIVRRLEKYYDVQIDIDESVCDLERFTGAVSLNASIGDVLRLINYDLKYDIVKKDEENYTISIRK